MKKLSLFIAIIALALSLHSCSNDSGGAGGTLSFKVNGVTKNFKVVPEKDTGFLFVYGYIGSRNNPTESVQFDMFLDSGSTVNTMESFIYGNPAEVNGSTTLLSNVTSQTANSINGTFTATITNISGGAPDMNITDGQFSFHY